MSTAVNDWWSDDPAERFWLVNEKWGEITDEGVIIAQEHDKSGNLSDFGRLCEFTHVGDILFHYSTREQAILWWSRITSDVWPDELDAVFATEDTDDEYVPALGFDYRVMHRLDEPITLAQLRAVEPELLLLRDDLLAIHGRPVYFPWLLSDKQPLNPAQRYLSKLPASAVSILESIGGFEIPDAEATSASESDGDWRLYVRLLLGGWRLVRSGVGKVRRLRPFRRH